MADPDERSGSFGVLRSVARAAGGVERVSLRGHKALKAPGNGMLAAGMG